MSQPTLLHVLLVDDSADDASLIARELARAEIACECRRVETETALRAALLEFEPDIVLADDARPPLLAEEVLALVRNEQPHTPVVLVTGGLSEEAVADYMKSGATDYVGKHHLHRLGMAVRRALAMRAQAEEARAAEAVRARNEDQLRKLVAHASEGVALLSATGHVAYGTPAVTSILGYEAGELTGRNVFELVHPDDRIHAQALLAEVLQSPRAVVRSVLRVLHKDRSWRDLDVTGSNQLGDAALAGIVVRYHDAGARSRAEGFARSIEERWRQTQKMDAISRLAIKVAHDLNNLLGSIRISCDLALIALGEGDTRVRGELLTIGNAIKRGSRLTRALIWGTRHEPVSRQRVDLNAFIGRVADMLRLWIGEHIVVQFDPAASVGVTFLDPGDLERILTSLADRAEEVMPAGGTLSLVTRDVEVEPSLARPHGVEPGPYVQVSIRDTGHGMDAETVARVLEPGLPSEDDMPAEGFSLAMIRRVVERWGGFVRLDSEVAKGTTVHLFLPWQP